ncbi:MAG: ABC transporter permease [Candidatus Aminicenantes bacterium]|nr:ABC transporter permease [Candidatus Aminicenantes bacterium]
MKAFLLKKTVTFFFSLWAAGSLVFLLAHTIPGDPVVALLGKMPSSEDVMRLNRSLKLDQPLAEQYAHFAKKLFLLDLGESIIDRKPVVNTIMKYFPNTAILAVTAMLMSILISFPLGILAALKKDSVWNTISMVISAIGLAVPGFLLGIFLIIIFSVRLKFLPISGSGGFTYLVLPAATLTISLSASLTRIIHAAVSGEIGQPYVILAKSKGLSEFQIFFRHILKNAMVPITTIMGLQLGALLSGTIVIENVFSWPGIGTLLITAIRQRDIPMIQGVALFMTALYLLLNLLVDLSYPFIDPRIRHDPF